MNKWEPFSIEAEQALLGAILMHNAAFERVTGLVSAEHFHEPIHREIFAICERQISAGRLATPVTIKPMIETGFDLGGVSLGEYIARLASEAITIGGAADLAKTVRELADKRTIGQIAHEMVPNPEADVGELASWVVDQMDTIASSRVSSTVRKVTLAESMDRAVEAAANAYETQGKMLGLGYGLGDLDQKTLGAVPGNLIILAGRPGMGKTAMAVCIARNFAMAGEPGDFYSLEMNDTELSQRMIADQMYDDGRFFYSMIRSGKFAESVFHRIRDAAQYLKTLDVNIEQQPQLTLAQIAARARQSKRKGKLKWLIVDHIGLVKASNRYAGNKVNETGEITIGLKALAKELEVPVIALAQIVRGVEAREDKRPALADLRNSGDIEQDADTVLLLYREAYYLSRKEPPAGSVEFQMWESQMAGIEFRLDVEVAKQRSGPTGSVRLTCDIGCNAIRSWKGDFA